MKELKIGDIIEPNCKAYLHIDGKEYASLMVKTDGSYVNIFFRRLKVTIPRVYSKSITEPDENGTYIRIYRPSFG